MQGSLAPLARGPHSGKEFLVFPDPLNLSHEQLSKLGCTVCTDDFLSRGEDGTTTDTGATFHGEGSDATDTGSGHFDRTSVRTG